jgi:hypothetical protein
MALCVSGPEWRGLAGGTIAYFGPMVDTSTCFKCRCTARLNFARGERLEASAKAACAPERSGRATTSFSASFRNAPAGKQRWPGNREDHGDDQGCQPRHMIGESRPKRGFRRAEHGQADARPFGITGGGAKIARLENRPTPRICRGANLPRARPGNASRNDTRRRAASHG